MARALQLCDYDVTHVLDEAELGKGTPDELIVPWCGRCGRVWVTVDHDPKSRHIRFSLLPGHRVHAIILEPEPKGVRAQLERVVTRCASWERLLGRLSEDSHGLWKQGLRGELKRC